MGNNNSVPADIQPARAISTTPDLLDTTTGRNGKDAAGKTSPRACGISKGKQGHACGSKDKAHMRGKVKHREQTHARVSKDKAHIHGKVKRMKERTSYMSLEAFDSPQAFDSPDASNSLEARLCKPNEYDRQPRRSTRERSTKVNYDTKHHPVDEVMRPGVVARKLARRIALQQDDVPKDEAGHAGHPNTLQPGEPTLIRTRSGRVSNSTPLQYDTSHHPLDFVTRPAQVAKKLGARTSTVAADDSAPHMDQTVTKSMPHMDTGDNSTLDTGDNSTPLDNMNTVNNSMPHMDDTGTPCTNRTKHTTPELLPIQWHSLTDLDRQVFLMQKGTPIDNVPLSWSVVKRCLYYHGYLLQAGHQYEDDRNGLQAGHQYEHNRKGLQAGHQYEHNRKGLQVFFQTCEEPNDWIIHRAERSDVFEKKPRHKYWKDSQIGPMSSLGSLVRADALISDFDSSTIRGSVDTSEKEVVCVGESGSVDASEKEVVNCMGESGVQEMSDMVDMTEMEKLLDQAAQVTTPHTHKHKRKKRKSGNITFNIHEDEHEDEQHNIHETGKYIHETKEYSPSDIPIENMISMEMSHGDEVVSHNERARGRRVVFAENVQGGSQ